MDDSQRRAAWGRVIARAWSDEGFKQRLVSEPESVLREEGIEIRDGVRVRVIADAKNERTIVIPAAPGDEELSDETLERIAAGVYDPESSDGRVAPHF